MSIKHIKSGMLVSVAAGLVLPAVGVQAENMNVTATVQEVCQIDTGIADLDFNNLTPGNPSDVVAISSVNWRCSTGTSGLVSISDGIDNDRDMDGPGGAAIPYEIYQDSGLTTVWGSGSDALPVTGTGMSAPTSQTIYGEVEASVYADAPPGSYSDVVSVTIAIN